MHSGSSGIAQVNEKVVRDTGLHRRRICSTGAITFASKDRARVPASTVGDGQTERLRGDTAALGLPSMILSFFPSELQLRQRPRVARR